MPYDAVDPSPCPDCGHLVYPPLVMPVRQAQRSCRALGASTPAGVTRCGCENVVHRLPTMRPRHRVEAPEPEPEREPAPAPGPTQPVGAFRMARRRA